ncbi:hypothetical protein MYU51_011499 [Penicillium brevicompactum]|uniref:uncharacterized protein n=1 Tax=Penicillium brevicompactum TaxID=5074 RepID=UPI00254269DB|nr:uncharacterized protein N7506_007409 [Penicillium brevicompactum]KAJ5333626.1 hypothetical protein N7506_007409 [Penicillium brevicompactum]
MSSSPSDSTDPDPNDQVEELDPEKFYHHPVWSQRWHHPEITEETSWEREQESWFENVPSRSRHRFLFDCPSNLPWGFIIYRTVYTTESEELWPIALERIAQRLKRGISSQVRVNSNESYLKQLIEESHKDVIISDPNRWNNASIQQVRSHFIEYLRKIKAEELVGQSRFASCLVIDEKSLKSIIADGGEKYGFLGAIDPQYNPEEGYDYASYRGYMRVQVKALGDLYMQLDWNFMCVLCPDYPDGWIPVYDGGYGTVQDEDGNEYPYAWKTPGGSEGRGRGRW